MYSSTAVRYSYITQLDRNCHSSDSVLSAAVTARVELGRGCHSSSHPPKPKPAPSMCAPSNTTGRVPGRHKRRAAPRSPRRRTLFGRPVCAARAATTPPPAAAAADPQKLPFLIGEGDFSHSAGAPRATHPAAKAGPAAGGPEKRPAGWGRLARTARRAQPGTACFLHRPTRLISHLAVSRPAVMTLVRPVTKTAH